MNISYEWDVEEQSAIDSDDYEIGDVIDHNHVGSYKMAIAVAEKLNQGGDDVVAKIVLVRDSAEGRSWAYVENGKLPDYFIDGNGDTTTKVPKRFK